MKVANIILSILILIMALASAAFSYFLFEKRDVFVNGWGKMATAIHNTSKTLDNNSGTKVAGKLAPEELSHEKYADLDSKLQMLTNQTRKVVAERDELADALRRRTVGVSVPLYDRRIRPLDVRAPLDRFQHDPRMLSRKRVCRTGCLLFL